MLIISNSHNAPATRRGLSAWLGLFLAGALLVLLMTVVAPLGLQLPGYKQVGRFIMENQLDATAIYYTDLETFSRAERIVRDGLRFAPAAR